MKIAIVVAGLIVVVAAVLVAVQPGFLKPASMALVKKSDILGFSPGMTFDETNKLVTQRRYRCRQIRDSYVLECAVDGAKVTIFADDVDPGNPDPKHRIWRVIAELNNPGPQDAAVKSISDQFNAQPTRDSRDGWIWTVGRGLKLSYDGAALKLVDEAEEIRRGKQEAKR
ncbi:MULTISPECIES: hypothetical protein [unclassified Bradyrhizobium]|jgi:hypothetical protein|uniref:hypothetical protein n=1 Tax=unclassified Bradyrhizobium TaxID=2631580 RepID=UPI00036D5033|nr:MULTISPECIES: hypothetical protein [unclassified Bradyrhizobium]MCK1323139.1 hypothetical protein [Bradyrhizobium sp. 156]MCK1354431.1 hypothetical protein [Bradyrhizobium sp. CW7]MCK1415681.1 hypothetical protein [Bradyrhizobium sp. CW4]MCK1501441.1 hypothetical protein [Bradyrhizobium sp. 188]MCK1526111.1 hypothetical protein [Bradyrhizobium sp. 17]